LRQALPLASRQALPLAPRAPPGVKRLKNQIYHMVRHVGIAPLTSLARVSLRRVFFNLFSKILKSKSEKTQWRETRVRKVKGPICPCGKFAVNYCQG